MRKKEARWISRNLHGLYEIWKEKPILKSYWWDGKTLIGSPCEAYLRYYAGIKLKKGGLARITIERQY